MVGDGGHYLQLLELHRHIGIPGDHVFHRGIAVCAHLEILFVRDLFELSFEPSVIVLCPSDTTSTCAACTTDTTLTAVALCWLSR